MLQCSECSRTCNHTKMQNSVSDCGILHHATTSVTMATPTTALQYEWSVYMFVMGALIFVPFMRYNSSAMQFSGVKPKNTLTNSRSKKIQ